MTESSAPSSAPSSDPSSDPSEPAGEAEPRRHRPRNTTEILIAVIVNLLAPLFLDASSGNAGDARSAAMETLRAYHARDAVDLMTIAEIIGFSFACLGSLSLSMGDDLPLSMTLRLRGNANALHRSAERNRRALEKRHADVAVPAPGGTAAAADDDVLDAAEEAEVIAAVQQAQRHAAQAQARAQAADQSVAAVPARSASLNPIPAAPIARAPTQAAPSRAAQISIAPVVVAAAFAGPTAAAPIAAASAPIRSAPWSTPTDPPAQPAVSAAEQRHRAAWAAGFAGVAAELAAELPDLPPQERRANAIRAAALSSSANALIGAAPQPPLRFSLPDAGKPAGPV